jgi:nitroreductase
MDTWQAVRTIRAVRAFDPRPLPDGMLERILDAGRHAGSSKNRQRWTFIAVTTRETLRGLSSVGPYAGHLAGAAAAVALVVPDPRTADAPLSIMWDLGRAAQNMVLVAWEAGIGSVPATVYDQGRARAILGYPADHHCEFVLSFGLPADASDLTRQPRSGGRREFEAVVRRERW